MARFTSIGMPRKTFVASTTEEAHKDDETYDDEPEAGPSTGLEAEESPKKKKHRAGRKLTQKRKRAAEAEDGDGDDVAGAAEAADADASGGDGAESTHAQDPSAPPVQSKKKAKLERFKAARAEREAKKAEATGWGRDSALGRKAKFAAERTEERRLSRIADKSAEITCFACREKGHSARECPNTVKGTGGSGVQALDGEKLGGEVTGTGKCYRCNSKEHSLSQCPKRADPSNPTPYATCFICLGQGHISAACPQNAKGVYVNGGRCVICSSVRHRAQDCPEERNKKAALAAEAADARNGLNVLGAGVGRGADEDDFMDDMRYGGGATARDAASGKRKKHAPNNNGPRAKYQKDESAAEFAPAAAKAKAKVVSF